MNKSDSSPAMNDSLLNIQELALNHMPDGVILFNVKEELVKFNTTSLKMFSVTQNKALALFGKPEQYIKTFDIDRNPVPADKTPWVRLARNEHINDEKFILEYVEKKLIIHASITGIPYIDQKGKFIGGILVMKDISDQISIERKLIEDKKLFQTIIDTVPVMISIYDKKLSTLILNKAFEHITGWPVNKHSETIERAFPNVGYRKEVIEFMKALNPGSKDINIHTKDDKVLETTWINVELPDQRCVGIGMDITERKQLERDLIHAKEKAEQENMIRYAFLQNISHEIRTPMNSILGYTELLYNKVKGKEENDFLDAISQSGSQLLRLIDDIIDYSRLDKNKMQIVREEISAQDIIDMAKFQVPGLEKIHKKKDLKFQFNLPPDSQNNVILSTDVHRINQVLTNLISNAIRYTEKGLIEIGYHINDFKKEVTFYVKDTGIGISEENHELIFERFVRLNDPNITAVRGTGLGLSICKQLVQLLGGEIGLESKSGEGSNFYFTHPYSKKSTSANHNLEIAAEMPVKVPHLENITLLIAEDDDFSFQMMRHMLTPTKATIIHANTGKAALEAMQDNSIDILFLDIRLPVMNGYQVIQKIRKTNNKLPVIAQTAYALPEDKQRMIDAGFTEHITKPFSKENLYNVLQKFNPNARKISRMKLKENM